MKTPKVLRILSVEDDADISELLHLMLQQDNPEYQITSVRTGAEGLALALTREFDLVVLDHRYPGITGTDICQRIRQSDWETSILFFSSSASEAERAEGMKCGADAYLIKPDDLGKLTETANQLLKTQRVSPAA